MPAATEYDGNYTNNDEANSDDGSVPATPVSSNRISDENAFFRSPTLSMSLRLRKRKLDFSNLDVLSEEDDEDYSENATPKRTPKKKGTLHSSVKKKNGSIPNKRLSGMERKLQHASISSSYTRKSHVSESDHSGLFTTIKTGKELSDAAEKWVIDYQADCDKAILQILQLVVDCCGCAGVIDSEMLKTKSSKEIVEELIDGFDENSSDYPLASHNQQWKRFRINYGRFFELLMEKCKLEIVYKVELMDNLLKILLEMSDSKVRSFRHTSTFTVMKVCTSLTEAISEMVKLTQKNTLQIEAERTKPGTSVIQIELLISARSELEKKTEELDSMVVFILKNILANRYRDVVADIRCICVEDLLSCMQIFPTGLLNDAYLKYIGWSLSDKADDVRLKAISGLLLLYSRAELIGQMELFTKTFVDRIGVMARDTSNEVATKACNTITLIYRLFPNLLEEKHCSPVCELVYAPSRTLAVAAGEFINAKLFRGNELPSSSMEVYSKTLAEQEFFTDLISFYVGSDVHQKNMSFLVDALVDSNLLLKNWPLMIEVLTSEDEDNFNSDVLVELIACAVKEAATNEAPLGRTPIPKRTGGALLAHTRALKEERTRISESFCPVIANLMDRFIDDVSKLVCLTTIPMFFQLELYFVAKRKLNNYLNDLMQVLIKCVKKHSDEKLLKNVAYLLNYFSTHDARVSTQIGSARKEMIADVLAYNVKQSMDKFFAHSEAEDEQSTEEYEEELLGHYSKLAAFSAGICIEEGELWDITLSMVKNEQDKFRNADLIEKGVLLLFQHLLWELKRIVAEKQDIDEARIIVLKNRRDQFLACVKSILENNSIGMENAYLCLCDCLIIFNFNIAVGSANYELMQHLPIKLGGTFHSRISDFVAENVFAPLEDGSFESLDTIAREKFEDKCKKCLGHYCKLIIHGLLPIIDASLVLRHYNKYSAYFDNILKTLLQKCREMDRVSAAKAVVLTLISVYKELKVFSADGIVDIESNEFKELCDLAKRFALSFGTDNVRNREAIVIIHKDGINFALNVEEQRRLVTKDAKPEDLSFLDVLIDFSMKLVNRDKDTILAYLIKHCPVNPEPNADDEDSFWQPYSTLKKVLTLSKKA